MDLRIGTGYDLHRLAPGRPLLLGGVRIPSEVGLLGHSDGDAVLHALCDALLGALGQPDIGDLFSDQDPRWKDADSRLFVREALERARAAGFCVQNADLVVLAQRPRLGAHKRAIQTAVAELLGVSPERVGIKATTNEGLGAIGRGEALACWATVLLRAESVDPG